MLTSSINLDQSRVCVLLGLPYVCRAKFYLVLLRFTWFYSRFYLVLLGFTGAKFYQALPKLFSKSLSLSDCEHRVISLRADRLLCQWLCTMKGTVEQGARDSPDSQLPKAVPLCSQCRRRVRGRRLDELTWLPLPIGSLTTTLCLGDMSCAPSLRTARSWKLWVKCEAWSPLRLRF